MISLARRITIGTVVLTTLTVGLAVGLVWCVAGWQLLTALDEELSSYVEHLRHMDDRPPPLRPMERDPPGRREFPVSAEAAPKARRDIQFVDADTGELFSHFPGIRPSNARLTDLMRTSPENVPVWLVAHDGRLLRGIHLTVQLREPIVGFTTAPVTRVGGYFATDATSAQADLLRLAIMLGSVWITASLLGWLSAWWLRRSVLGPLRRLGLLIDGIDSTRLEPIKVDVPKEVHQVVALLNQLLERLSLLMSREKTTIANIAHELRSPISGLRTSMEVAALQPGLSARELVDRCFPTVVAMHGMVVNLLALSRLEAGHGPIGMTGTDIQAVITAAWAMHAGVATGRGVRLALFSDDIPPVCTAPDKIRMVINNLVSNAVSYSPRESAVVISLRRRLAVIEVTIANQMAGPAPDLQRIFEPFYRGDTARSSHVHCGLGLTLAHRLAALLSLEMKIEVEKDWFRASLALPIDLPTPDGLPDKPHASLPRSVQV